MKDANNRKPGVPLPRKGKNLTIKKNINLASAEEASRVYNKVKDRLADINNWDQWSGKGSGIFTLTDPEGTKKNNLPAIGDYIKIKIPAPKSANSDGFDWVKIDKIDSKNVKDTDERYIIQVHPSQNPLNKNNEVSHFLDSDATSTFIVSRKGKQVAAEIYGRNELPNVEKAQGVFNKLRNIVVGLFATAGLARIQWEKLAAGLLEFDNN
ncbi:MAG: hypothetical protein H0W62_07440 [Chitinophagales bacterium]|nr:hypothetical protein [Chitinophagales bacterium]